MNDTMITLDLPPVGIRIIGDRDSGYDHVERFRGVSYCQAVLKATFGREVVLEPGSIQVCQWAPVVLGHKEPENEFEKSINRRFPVGTGSFYLAPIAHFNEERRPDVVVIRARPGELRAIVQLLGYGSFIPYGNYNRDETALAVIAEGPKKGFSQWAIRNVNRWLNWMNGFALWQKTTTFLFRSTVITWLLDRFITKHMANMSVCRNSTLIPRQTGRANISHFCTGGIAWGKNFPDFLTSGFPYEIFRRIEPHLSFPGSREHDNTSAESKRLMEKMLNNASKIKGCVS
jgi:uncharacterized protein (DUF169 family)